MRAVILIVAACAWLAACSGSSDDGSSGGAPTRPSDSATSTPEPPPATPNPLATPPADWFRFAVDDRSIWLPPRFVGGSLASGRSLTLERISSLGGVCGQLASTFEALGDGARLLAVDADRCATGTVTNLVILKQDRQGFTPADYTEQLTSQLGETLVIGSSGIVTLGSREAGRVVIDGRKENTGVGRSVQYYIPSGDVIWALIFASGTDLPSLLPEIDRIALTFEDSLPDN